MNDKSKILELIQILSHKTSFESSVHELCQQNGFKIQTSTDVKRIVKTCLELYGNSRGNFEEKPKENDMIEKGDKKNVRSKSVEEEVKVNLIKVEQIEDHLSENGVETALKKPQKSEEKMDPKAKTGKFVCQIDGC